jgi:acetolactate synthase-1/3 small subunit
MSKEVKQYTISVITENRTDLLIRVIMIFTRRQISIASLNAEQSSIEGVSHLTIVVNESEDLVKKLVQQIDKQIEVLKSFFYENHQNIKNDIALYKELNTDDITQKYHDVIRLKTGCT